MAILAIWAISHLCNLTDGQAKDYGRYSGKLHHPHNGIIARKRRFLRNVVNENVVSMRSLCLRTGLFDTMITSTVRAATGYSLAMVVGYPTTMSTIAPVRVLFGKEVRSKSSRFYTASISVLFSAYLRTRGVW